MGVDRNTVRDEVLGLLQQLAEDWEYDSTIDEQTGLLLDMGLESLDLVVLATSLQEQFQQEMPFTTFFADLGQREQPDVTAGEWVDFVYSHLNGAGQPSS